MFYGQSDLYYICRLKALTFDLVPCPQEIDECQWKSIDELLNTENATPFVKMICRLLRHGKETGFHKIDINEHDVENWARKGNRMKIFHRNLEPYHWSIKHFFFSLEWMKVSLILLVWSCYRQCNWQRPSFYYSLHGTASLHGTDFEATHPFNNNFDNDYDSIEPWCLKIGHKTFRIFITRENLLISSHFTDLSKWMIYP